MKKTIYLLAVLCGLLFSADSLQGQVTLPALIRDSMVIQRDTEWNLWGWASAGEQVRVRFNGKRYKTRTGPDGTWKIQLPPVPAGGPYTLEITASNHILLNDILAGDVWVCAGQSNMVHYLGIHNERYAAEIASANYPEIRQFLVPSSSHLEGPAADLAGGSWKWANPEDVNSFSVVAYFFALQLHEKYMVPIGIINASVGGTPIEAWTSEEGLQAFPGMVETIQRNMDTAYVNGANRAAMADRRAAGLGRGSDAGSAGPVSWSDPDYIPRNWHPIYIPGYWEDQGVRNLDGVVWYRKVIEVPEHMTGMAARVVLGRIVDADQLYINGVQVGRTTYQYPQRRYQVAPGVLKPGRNLFVIRVQNNSGKGGFVPDKPYCLVAGGDTIDLTGQWQYRVGEVYQREGFPRMGIAAQNQPTALFNGMVAPYTDYAVKGFVWYQGESNASRAGQYKELLPALINDWREQWKNKELPFLYVQLPNFMEVNYSPEESDWALLREAQLEALQLPLTGMAVAIDLGEWNDIHPDRKKPVGERLALAARKVAYGEGNLVWSGPLYRSHRVDGNRVIITFDHTGSGLVSGDGEELGHFAVAGPDRKFRWATAIIEDNRVVLWNDRVPDPKYVRYGWADNPRFANLYNKEGLPASPFRFNLE